MKTVLIWEVLPYILGGQKVSLQVADILKKEYRCIFLIPEEGELSAELEKRGVEYFTFFDSRAAKSNPVKFAFSSAKAIALGEKICRQNKVDLIYAPGATAIPWATVCGKICRLPVYWHLHHIFEDGRTVSLLNKLASQNCVKRIIAVSDAVASQINGNDDKKTVLYNYIDVQRFENGSRDNIVLPFEINADDIVIASAAVLQRSKKQDYIIMAASVLKSRGLGVKVILLGASRPDDTVFEDELRTMISELEMENEIFLAGYHTNVEDYFAPADVVVIPSVEGFPISGIEAVCADCVIIGRKGAGTAEMVELDSTGFVWNETGSFDADCNELADCILNAYEYKHTAEFEKGRAGAMARYSKENFERIAEGLFF